MSVKQALLVGKQFASAHSYSKIATKADSSNPPIPLQSSVECGYNHVNLNRDRYLKPSVVVALMTK